MWEYTFGLDLKDKIKKKCSLADAKRIQRKAIDIKVDMATRRYTLIFKFLVLSLMDVERVGVGVRGERETEDKRDRGAKEGGREGERAIGGERKGGR